MENKGEVLVAFDDSPAAHAALEWAIGYATEHERRVLLLYVVSSLDEWELAALQVNPDPIRRRFDQLLRGEWSASLRRAGVPHRTKLVVGRPAQRILETARAERVELIVLGMTERGILHEIVMGATGRHVINQAVRPVVAVPAEWGANTLAVAGLATRSSR